MASLIEDNDGYLPLTQEQIESIINSLPIHRTYPYRSDIPSHSANMQRLEEDGYHDMVRELLANVTVDGSISLEELKGNILSALAAEGITKDLVLDSEEITKENILAALLTQSIRNKTITVSKTSPIKRKQLLEAIAKAEKERGLNIIPSLIERGILASSSLGNQPNLLITLGKVSDASFDKIHAVAELSAKGVTRSAILTALNEYNNAEETPVAPLHFVHLSEAEKDEILSIFDSFYSKVVAGTRVPVTINDENGLYLPRPNTFFEATQHLAKTYKKYLRAELDLVTIDNDVREYFTALIKVSIHNEYINARLPPGTSVGTIAGQSTGQESTQATLNVHKAAGIAAARVATASTSRTQELFNVSVPKVPSLTIYFNETQTYESMKRYAPALRDVYIKDVLSSQKPIIFSKDTPPTNLGIEWHKTFDLVYRDSTRSSIAMPVRILRIELDTSLCYMYKITPKAIGDTIERHFSSVRCLYTPLSRFKDGSPCVVDIYVNIAAVKYPKDFPSHIATPEYALRIVYDSIMKLRISGIEGVASLFPYSMPIVRFFTVKEESVGTAKSYSFVLDRSFMKIEGVNGEQIVDYISSRLRHIRKDNRISLEVLRTKKGVVKKIIAQGLTKKDAESVKNYAGLEPISTFVTVNKKKNKINVIGTKSTISITLLTQVAAEYGMTPTILEHILWKELLPITIVRDADDDKLTITLEDVKAQRVISGDYLVDISSILPLYNQWSYQTIGSNLPEVLALPWVSNEATTSDDPNEILEVFGIAATNAYLTEGLNLGLNFNRSLDIRHIALIADTMCVGGRPLPVSRYGGQAQEIGGLAKASNEQATRNIAKSSFHGDIDPLSSPASRLMFSKVVGLGAERSLATLEEPFIPRQMIAVDLSRKKKPASKPAPKNATGKASLLNKLAKPKSNTNTQVNIEDAHNL
jgi:hypothetical protein